MKPYQTIACPCGCSVVEIYLAGTFDGMMTIVMKEAKKGAKKR